MTKATAIKDTDYVLPLRYYEGRNIYHVPAFKEPYKFSWYKNHAEEDFYIRDIDIGIYEIGSFNGAKLPNLKKVTVECPYEQDKILQPVSDNILFCPSCAPHKYVKGGEILKKQWRISDCGVPIYYE